MGDREDLLSPAVIEKISELWLQAQGVAYGEEREKILREQRKKSKG